MPNPTAFVVPENADNGDDDANDDDGDDDSDGDDDDDDGEPVASR